MDLYGSSFHVNSPESWLILSIYGVFWVSGYYSLIVLLIHTRKQNNPVDDMELEENSPDISL